MIKALFVSAVLFSHTAVTVAASASAPVKLDFQAVHVSQVVGLVYMEAVTAPYVIDPALMADDRLVSFRFDTSRGDLMVFWRVFLDSLGYSVAVRAGTHFIFPKPKAGEEAHAVTKLTVYRPKHRSVRYLVDLLSGVFPPSGFVVQRAVPSGSAAERAPAAAPPNTAASLVDVDSDVLVFNGNEADAERLLAVLPSLDTPTGEVVVKAVVYEVTTGRSEASAFSLAASILGGRFGVSVGSSGALQDALSLRSGSIDMAISAFKGDSRFKAVSTPSVRVKSGQRAHLMVGQDVPTLGSVSYAQGSNVPVQSVEYRSSGVIFDLTPTVRDGGIEILVDQQISDFARTESGVNNSPTLTKRSLVTTVGMQDGELILLGGLSQDKSTSSRGGQSFLPEFMRSKDVVDSRTEVLLMLQVSKVVSLN